MPKITVFHGIKPLFRWSLRKRQHTGTRFVFVDHNQSHGMPESLSSNTRLPLRFRSARAWTPSSQPTMSAGHSLLASTTMVRIRNLRPPYVRPSTKS